MNIKNIMAFCILMQDIKSKSPGYIKEKCNRYLSEDSDPEAWRWGLDADNTALLQKWLDKWKVEKVEEDNGTIASGS